MKTHFARQIKHQLRHNISKHVIKLLKFCGIKYKIELIFLQKNILTSRKISLKVNKIMQNIPYSSY